MKLVVGMGALDSYRDYKEAGADEVFLGYVPRLWQEKYGLTTPFNRREVCYYNVQIGARSELEILAEERERLGLPVTIACNSISYQAGLYPLIGEIMEECAELGFSSFIVADLGLLVFLERQGLTRRYHIHVSGDLGEINSPMLKELADLGMSRLIFHRKVSLGEMEALLQEGKKLQGPFGPLEYEAFLLNENCHFHGGYCNSLHCDELVPMCRMPYEIRTARKEVQGDGAFDYDYGSHQLKEMEKIGISHLKIVGRGADSDYMKYCIRQMRDRLDHELYLK